MGFATTDMASAIDPTVGNYMNLNGIPGGAVAITYRNHLIFAKSYGYVDVGNAQFAEPDSRFRTASVSKAITAMGILKLVHDGHLSLEDHPFPFSGVGPVIGGVFQPLPPSVTCPALYLSCITVDDLLHHASGWNRNIAPDLEGYDTLQTVEGLLPKHSGPPDCTTLLSYVESQPLQFNSLAGGDGIPATGVVPLHAYDDYNFIKDGGYEGTVSSVSATADGYGFAAVFNGNDNTAPAPQTQVFWSPPGFTNCATGPKPLPASSSGNCALQAAYDHATTQPWDIDFFPQYSRGYSGWMNEKEFATYLADQKSRGLYPSRLEGRAVAGVGSHPTVVFQYRGRFGPGTVAPQIMYGQACSTVLGAIQAAPADTPLVSLQRFYDSCGSIACSSGYVYQAIWSAPIPQLPPH